MPRYLGVKNNNIYIVSDKKFSTNNLQVIEVPPELNTISSADLIADYKVKQGKVVHKKSRKSAKELKIALVGNWKMKCGIATYSENLWGKVAEKVNDVKLFIEENDSPTSPLNELGNLTLSNDKILSCWKRGESSSKLIKAIKEYDPDIIWIQHEFGLWSNASNWLVMMNQLSEYRIIVTMHSVFHHKDKTICEAAIPEIVVHLPGAVTLLKEEKQVPSKVHLIPHGCAPCLTRDRLWNFYKSIYTFVQFGFGFRYKGWENSIRAAALLKDKYPQVFFTGLFSESPFAKVEHQIYYNELMDLINELGVQENVAIIRGYQSDATLDSYLRTNQVSIFPYVSSPEHEVFGASGAARFAMAKGIPVITSSVNHFSDLPTIKADTPEQIAQELEKLFGHWDVIKSQVDKQINYINENTWDKIADKYIELFES
jgi:glycosyltransferase involved in cell wall biosynthesis